MRRKQNSCYNPFLPARLGFNLQMGNVTLEQYNNFVTRISKLRMRVNVDMAAQSVNGMDIELTFQFPVKWVDIVPVIWKLAGDPLNVVTRRDNEPYGAFPQFGEDGIAAFTGRRFAIGSTMTANATNINREAVLTVTAERAAELAAERAAAEAEQKRTVKTIRFHIPAKTGALSNIAGIGHNSVLPIYISPNVWVNYRGETTYPFNGLFEVADRWDRTNDSRTPQNKILDGAGLSFGKWVLWQLSELKKAGEVVNIASADMPNVGVTKNKVNGENSILTFDNPLELPVWSPTAQGDAQTVSELLARAEAENKQLEPEPEPEPEQPKSNLIKYLIIGAAALAIIFILKRKKQ